METKEKEFYTELKDYQKKRNSISHGIWSEKKKEFDLTESLLNMLSNKREHEFSSFSDELSSLSRVISRIADSIDEDVLTKEEAEMLINRMFSAFISRRMDNIVDNLFSKRRTNWFLAAKQHFYEQG